MKKEQTAIQMEMQFPAQLPEKESTPSADSDNESIQTTGPTAEDIEDLYKKSDDEEEIRQDQLYGRN